MEKAQPRTCFNVYGSRMYSTVSARVSAATLITVLSVSYGYDRWRPGSRFSDSVFNRLLAFFGGCSPIYICDLPGYRFTDVNYY
jgi:hypothetical protein